MSDPRERMRRELVAKLDRVARLPNSVRALTLIDELADKLLQYKANRRKTDSRFQR